MGFNVRFFPGTWTGEETAVELPDLDDGFETVVMDACALLAEAEGAEFVISGFGRARWPVDVDYDMSVFAEQLPDLLTCVRSRERIDVDLYSQGIECMLTFAPVGDDVVITATSRTDWVPDPENETHDRIQLLEMLDRLAADIARGMQTIDASLVSVPPFDDWIAGSGDRTS